MAAIVWKNAPVRPSDVQLASTAHEEADRAAKVARRWAQAAQRANAERIQVRPSRVPGRWLTVYRDAERGRVEHVVTDLRDGQGSLGCDCHAARQGDPVCKHRAAVMVHLGVLPAPARYTGCPGCGAPAPWTDCDCNPPEAAPTAQPAPRIAWKDATATKRRAALAEARAHLGYLLHHERAALSDAALDSLRRALRLVNAAEHAG